MTEYPQILKLRVEGYTLGVELKRWKDALERVVVDEVVAIRHAAIEGTEERRIHVASTPNQVGCHFHAHGDEEYAVVSGKGILHWGKVTRTEGGTVVNWEQPLPVKSGDSFTIPEGYAHQLRNDGTTALIILFACPDSHLNDNQDRHRLPASPGIPSSMNVSLANSTL